MLNFDLACDGLEFVNIPRARLLLNRKQPQIERILVVLSEEIDEESTSLEDL